MHYTFTRREMLTAGGAAAAAAMMPTTTAAESAAHSKPQFRYCLNTSTIRGQKLDLLAEIELAARAGYDGIEPWIREIEAYRDAGGSLQDLATRLRDAGLTVESAIGFAPWIVDDDDARRAGLEQAK